MPTPEERAEAKRRHAEKREREERERREATQAEKERMREIARAALLTRPTTHAPARVDDLLPDVLQGANLAVQSLLACMSEGLVQPRDLATVASVLMRAAREMQSAVPEEPPSLAELEAAEREAERLLAERKAR